MNLQTVLLPTDFSQCAHAALEYTLELAGVLPVSRLILLHSIIYNDSAFIGSVERERENTIRYNQARENMEQWVKYIAEKNSGIRVQEILDAGAPVQTIDDIAAREKVDLIIMGTKGASGIREVVIGSYAASVIKCSQSPVLVIPENFRFRGISKIVCTTDFHHSELPAINSLMDLVRLLKASVIFLNTDEDPQKQNVKVIGFHQTFETQPDDPPIQFELIVSSDIVKSIEKYVADNNPDMVVTLGKRRHFWDKLFGEKVSKSLSFHVRVPLLSFPVKDC